MHVCSLVYTDMYKYCGIQCTYKYVYKAADDMAELCDLCENIEREGMGCIAKKMYRVGDEADHDECCELTIEGRHIRTPEIGTLLEAARERCNDAHQEANSNDEPEPLAMMDVTTDTDARYSEAIDRTVQSSAP